jgi:hypothetical protein
MAQADQDGYIFYPGLTGFPSILGHEFSGVVVEAGKKAPLGAQVITATVSSSGETLEQISLTANITKASGSILRTVLEVVLVVFVVILLIIGLIIGFNKLRSNDEEEASQKQRPITKSLFFIFFS